MIRRPEEGPMRWSRPLALAVAAAALGGGCARPDEPDARFVSVAEIKGFDPVFTSDSYASGAQKQIFESLLEIHPLKRPLELQPLLAEAMPEVSADGLAYTFRIRADARYQDDPCFPGGKGRAVTARDFIWCWKRLAAVPTSQGSWIFEGRIKGLEEWTAKVKARLRPMLDHVNEWYPFESPDLAALVAEEVPGLAALDDRTLRVELTNPFPQFLWVVAMGFGVVYPREAVERYGMDFMNHPVGCGPYRVQDYFVYDRKVVYVRNPNWHGQKYPEEGAPGDREAGLLDDAGKDLPFLDRVEFLVVKQSQPRWLKFLEGDVDRVETEKEIWARAMTADGKLRDDLVAKGVRVLREPMANVAFTAFNMDDAVVGSPAGDRGRKLRQAMSLAYDVKRWIDVMRNGFWADPADGPIPPNVAGWQRDVKSAYAGRDLARAKRLLAEAGYPEGRGLPVLSYEMSGNDAVSRNGSEIFKNCMQDVGIKVELSANTWDQFITKVEKKSAQILGMSWTADYPDAENFLQLFYGPNESPKPNNSNYKNPKYDALYERMAVMPHGPARDAVIREMLAMVNEDCPWSYTDYRTQYSYVQPWLRNFKYMDIDPWLFKYYRVDRAEKARRLAGATK
jgi:oligopeptide transport system substrate-binding protein